MFSINYREFELNLMITRFGLLPGTYVSKVSQNLLLIFLISLSLNLHGQTPCDALRWTGNGSDAWNPDGTIQASGDEGIVGCGSSAATESNIMPNSTYNSGMFTLDTTGLKCFSPNSGNSTTIILPQNNQDIIWVQFDSRAFAASYEYQLVTNKNIGWILYASAGTPEMPSPGAVPSNCSGPMTPLACGDDFNNTFAIGPVPVFNQPTNLYLAIWDQDNDLSNPAFSVNFKARFGCGDSGIPICALDPPVADVICSMDGTTYTVSVQITGSNGEFEAIDPNANSISGNVCLGNLASGNLMDFFTLTYDYNENYSITIQEVSPSTIIGCADPINSADCIQMISGGPPANCQPCPCISQPLLSGDLNVDLGCDPTMDAMMGILGNVNSSTPDLNCMLSMITYMDGNVMSNGCNRSKIRTYSVSTVCGMLTQTFDQTISWIESNALSVSCPQAVMLPACSTENDIVNAYNTWAAGFMVNDGCNTMSNIQDIPQLPAYVCGGAVNLDFALSATDDCNTTPLTCASSFTVTAATSLSVSCPQAVMLPACSTENDIINAYNTWAAGFMVNDGCNPMSNIQDIPQLPAFVCGGAVNLDFMLSAIDDCNTTPLTCASSFTVTAAIPLSVSCPQAVMLPACSTENDIINAYNTWAAGFMVNDGCNPP